LLTFEKGKLLMFYPGGNIHSSPETGGISLGIDTDLRMDKIIGRKPNGSCYFPYNCPAKKKVGRMGGGITLTRGSQK